MRIGGIIDISTKDIPNRSTMVIFTVGCNLSCSFCHNKYLLHEGVGRDIDVPELMAQIKSNMLVSGEAFLEENLRFKMIYLNCVKKLRMLENISTLTQMEQIRNLLLNCYHISTELP